VNFFLRIRKNTLFVLGTIIILVLFTLALGANFIAPHSPFEQNLDKMRTPPFTNPQFPLGTDELGRDLMSRVIFGGRISLSVGLFTSTLSAAVGITLGLLAGFSSPFLSEVIERVTDIALATPEILIALALSAIFGRGLFIVMISVSLVWWANYARIVRGQVLQLREMDYVLAVQALGASKMRILWFHILPNASAEILVMVSLNMSAAILVESGLSFLGLGTTPPNPSWGAMLSTARNYLQTSPWLATIPGLAIIFTVLGFNLIGDGLRDILDPRMR
jgi:ABC-type dipeptide/oligopeptide/nickel transport system permease subunit